MRTFKKARRFIRKQAAKLSKKTIESVDQSIESSIKEYGLFSWTKKDGKLKKDNHPIHKEVHEKNGHITFTLKCPECDKRTYEYSI